jgi:arylsulfatase A-like enzyme
MTYLDRLILILLATLVVHACSQKSANIEKPNIVFILADDLGYGDLQCYNADSKIPTPHIDRLAEEGVVFVDAHAPGAWCVPSRYGLITGRYPAQVKLNWAERSLIEKEQTTLGSLLQQYGYRTAIVGKWHLGFDSVDWKRPASISRLPGGPVERGFDYFYGLHASLDIPPYFYIENDRAVQAPTAYVDDHASADATTAISGAFYREGAVSPDFRHTEVLDRLLEKSQSFIAEHFDQHASQPFFLYLPLTAPHTPWLPKPEFAGKSGAGEYGDFTMQVDELIGQLMQYLKDNGLRENTMVFFASDNGPVWFEADVEKFDHRSTGTLRGMKVDFWEGGSRIPFIASWPDHFASGAYAHQLVCFTDILATLAEVAGDSSFDASAYDSHSILPILMHPGSAGQVRETLLIEDKVYRSGNWKYIEGNPMGVLHRRFDPDSARHENQAGPAALYNLEYDLDENNNLLTREPQIADSLRRQLQILTGDQRRIRQVLPEK